MNYYYDCYVRECWVVDKVLEENFCLCIKKCYIIVGLGMKFK